MTVVFELGLKPERQAWFDKFVVLFKDKPSILKYSETRNPVTRLECMIGPGQCSGSSNFWSHCRCVSTHSQQYQVLANGLCSISIGASTEVASGNDSKRGADLRGLLSASLHAQAREIISGYAKLDFALLLRRRLTNRNRRVYYEKKVRFLFREPYLNRAGLTRVTISKPVRTQ